jgi:GNAT superfamily N-acetyltransferase
MNIRLFAFLIIIFCFRLAVAATQDFTFQVGGDPLVGKTGTPIRIFDLAVSPESVGHLTYKEEGFFSTKATIWNLYVENQRRNNNYGTALMRYAKKYLCDQGYESIALIPEPYDRHTPLTEAEVAERLPQLQGFYTKLEFKSRTGSDYWIFENKNVSKKRLYLCVGVVVTGAVIYKRYDVVKKRIIAFVDHLKKRKNNKKSLSVVS